MKKLLPVFWVFLFTSIANAQPGTLDMSYNTYGWTSIGFPGHDDIADDLVLQPDGKLLVAGSMNSTSHYDFAITRFNPDGTLDSAFGFGGGAFMDFGFTNDYVGAVVLQPDHKIIVGGSVWDGVNQLIYLVRFNPDGSIDNTFDTDGIVSVTTGFNVNSLYDIVLQDDGRIVICGSIMNGVDNDFLVVRLLSDGSLDVSFDNNGVFIGSSPTPADVYYSIAIDGNGKIVVAGTHNNADFTIARYNSDGSADNTFSIDGEEITNNGLLVSGKTVCLQPDGKILVGGHTFDGVQTDFAIVRYNVDGTLDNGFDGDGIVMTDVSPGGYDKGRSLVIQPDNKIILAGGIEGSAGALIRYNTDGTLDAGFGSSGMVTTDFGIYTDGYVAASITNDLKLVVCGFISNGVDYDFLTARYLTGLNLGELSFLSGENAVLIYPNPIEAYATLTYTLLNETEISVEIFDEQGKRLQSPVSGQFQSAGTHQQFICFDGFSAGNYLLVISSPEGKISLKLIKT